jgi:hypothetical protein
VATPDQNGDGKADIIFHNSATGNTAACLMNGLDYLGTTEWLHDANWKITALADFDADSRSDELWPSAASQQRIAYRTD